MGHTLSSASSLQKQGLPSPAREGLAPTAEREATGGERCGSAPGSRPWGCDLFLHQEDARLGSAQLSRGPAGRTAQRQQSHLVAACALEKPQHDSPWQIQRPSSSTRTMPRICFPLKITSRLGSWASVRVQDVDVLINTPEATSGCGADPALSPATRSSRAETQCGSSPEIHRTGALLPAESSYSAALPLSWHSLPPKDAQPSL